MAFAAFGVSSALAQVSGNPPLLTPAPPVVVPPPPVAPPPVPSVVTPLPSPTYGVPPGVTRAPSYGSGITPTVRYRRPGKAPQEDEAPPARQLLLSGASQACGL